TKYYLDNLEIFYNTLNREFTRFYERLSFWEELKEPEKDKFMAVIQALPAAAVENYKRQYYQLAVNFNDFFVWTNLQQHQILEHKIDIGFSELTRLITTYEEKSSNTRALTTLEHYRKNINAISTGPLLIQRRWLMTR
ncbi:MAG: hypothetical protein K2H40_06545, partial [Lachnospiraceae bacterium]|nr:hypothetical protein [Lachnospiraceae bacterium]